MKDQHEEFDRLNVTITELNNARDENAILRH
jgi:hypothetical protein